MGRHNREARGEDQHGRQYDVSFPPDWLHQVKVTRTLANGRQSTRTLLRNPGPAEQRPGARVRTRISSPDPKLEFAIEIEDPHGVVSRIIVETRAPEGAAHGGVGFSIEARAPRAAPRGRGGSQKT